MIPFKNTYIKLPEDFYEKSNPAAFGSPELIIFNEDLAQEIGIDLKDLSDQEIANIFSGQTIVNGSEPLAQAYAGFQFGHPNPQLGDGRAHLLGEVSGYDIQLKGSGQTRFSRNGDGRSALGPVLREYIVSEAMHTLGVPSTRALCAVTTGEQVLRQFGPEPGGVFTRVAESHLRVGTFQYFMFKDDKNSIEILLNYTIARHYPEYENLPLKDKAIAFLKVLTKKQSELIAKWSSLGFIHGVMNTDNFSVAGITIDYGPCAFMDEFRFDKVFSSIDRNGRYAFYNQVPIAKWNLLRLAECLLPLICDNQEEGIELINKEVISLFDSFEENRSKAFAKKLGIIDYSSKDETLVTSFLKYLEDEELDFTLAFRNLPKLFDGDKSFYSDNQALDEFLVSWKARVNKVDQLNKINPLYIPRNHQVEKAIQLAYQNDFSHFHELNEVLKNPYEQQDGKDDYSMPPTNEERIYETFCGT